MTDKLTATLSNERRQRASNTPLEPQDVRARLHHEKMLQHICTEIDANDGFITFARFMELVLYAPNFGYYHNGIQYIDIKGDFVTAVEISPLFSQCIASQCEQVLSSLGKADILEFGAGTGNMAANILLELELRSSLPEHYYILDLSESLKEKQQQTLQERCPHLLERIHWLNQLPNSFEGVMLANEVLDAMPIHLFQQDKTQIQERYVTHKQQQLQWMLGQPSSEALYQAIRHCNISEEATGYQSEINLYQSAWIKSIAECLKSGLILLIDYGFPHHEYYHPDRSMGTLMCHYQHHAHGNPLILLGLQDITSHVDFTAVAEAADESKLDVNAYTNQATFLLNCGILERLNATQGAEQAQLSRQIQKLIMPHEMGELFKVIALTKNLDVPLLGFRQHDKKYSL